MTETPDAGADPSSAAEVALTVEANGVRVEKIAENHRGEAVKVAVTVESTREDRCDVRLVDPLPEPVRDRTVEFHPDADTSGWSHAETAVVYEGTLAPGATVAVVYGVRIDQLSQLERFSTDPVLEVTAVDDIFDYWSDDAPTEPADPDGSPAITLDGSVTNRSASEPRDGAETDTDGTVVDQLVVELQNGEVSEADRTAIREALGLEAGSASDHRLEALREEVETLRATVAGTDQPANDLDLIESELAALSADVANRFESLSAEIEALQNEVERAARWRSTVHDAIVLDPEDE